LIKRKTRKSNPIYQKTGKKKKEDRNVDLKSISEMQIPASLVKKSNRQGGQKFVREEPKIKRMHVKKL